MSKAYNNRNLMRAEIAETKLINMFEKYRHAKGWFNFSLLVNIILIIVILIKL